MSLDRITWFLIMALFCVSYFFLAKSNIDKIEKCCFFTVLVLFNMWRVLVDKK